MYRQIPGFREYVLIEQDKYVVDVHFKHEKSDLWLRYSSFLFANLRLDMQTFTFKKNI